MFAGIALFVGAFIIFNTFSITVAQRMREFALLRTLGASRRQILRSVVLEAAARRAGRLGARAARADSRWPRGSTACSRSSGCDLPAEGTEVLATRTIVVAPGHGTVVTVVAALSPALRATRVPPIAALREGAVLPPGAYRTASGRRSPSGSLAIGLA